MIDALSTNALIEIIQGILGVLAAAWVAALVAMRAPAYQRPAWAAIVILVADQLVTLVYRLTFRAVIEQESDVLTTLVNLGINLCWGGSRLAVLWLAVATAVAAAQRRTPPFGLAHPRG